ncbi:hypothetical protein C0J52_12766 [Blattella germanica]|nr:hypothetical protein C0J52_12766 [Blattella germanica]
MILIAARVGRREPCTKCGLPVFIAERLLVGRHLYHRTCFRCARCQHQLSIANCYETEGGEYCCETCPDEVLADKEKPDNQDTLDMMGHPGPDDEYSANFESAMDKSFQSIEEKEPVMKFSKARTDFISSQLEESQDSIHSINSDSEENETVPLQTDHKNVSSLPLQSSKLPLSIAKDQTTDSDTGSSKRVHKLGVVSSASSHEDGNSIDAKYFFTKLDNTHTARGSVNSGNVSEKDVPISDSSSDIKNSVYSKQDQLVTANDSMSHVHSQDTSTKDSDSEEVPASSIVRMRLQMFEKSSKETKTISNTRYAQNQRDSFNEDSNSTQTHISGATHKDLTKNDVSIDKDMIDDDQRKPAGKVTILTEDTPGKSDTEFDEMFQGIYEDSLKTESQLNFDDISAEDNVINTILMVPNDDLEIDKRDTLKAVSPIVRSLESEMLTVPSDGSEHDKSDTPKAVSPIARSVKSEILTVPSDGLELDKSDLPKAVSPIPKSIESEIQTSSSSEILEKNEEVTYPKDLNPFGEENDNDDEDYDDLKHVSVKRIPQKPPEEKPPKGTNPFGSSDEDEDEEAARPVPVARQRTPQKVIEAPRVSLNPFWSDGEEPSSEDETASRKRSSAEKPPIPLPRTVIGLTPEPSPMPRKSLAAEGSDKFGSVSSLSSLNSSTGGTTQRKKKPAPTPPRAQDVFLGTPGTPTAISATSSRASSPCPSSGQSPKATPRHRKKSRPAPPPPGTLTFAEAKLLVSEPDENNSQSGSAEWEREKNKKDVANRNRQSQALSNVSLSPLSPGEQQLSIGPNKSTYGQWKRKKGPAPPRPVPQRRQIKAIPMKEVKRELDDIEVQQQELERQGVTLEKTIRDKFDQQPNPEDDSSMTPDVEDLVLQLFELVNEKNELFRRQAELMYLRRQQRLEEEHADLEYQIRCLMLRPDHTKTDSDKAREEELIQRLVEVVERRNEIVECLEMDRIREAEEDRSIHSRLGMFSKGKTLSPEEISSSKSHSGKKQKKKNKKDKEKHSSKKTMKPGLDADKDIDEAVEEVIPKHTKEKKTKRKWF